MLHSRRLRKVGPHRNALGPEFLTASNEELRAAPLSAKRLLALWNALPDVEKRKKVGDRDALIDQLWSAIEALPDPEPQSDPSGEILASQTSYTSIEKRGLDAQAEPPPTAIQIALRRMSVQFDRIHTM